MIIGKLRRKECGLFWMWTTGDHFMFIHSSPCPYLFLFLFQCGFLFSLPKGMNKVYDHDQINLSISVSKMRIVNYFSHYIHAQNLPNYSDTSNLLIGNLKFKKNPWITKERTITDIKEQSHTF